MRQHLKNPSVFSRQKRSGHRLGLEVAGIAVNDFLLTFVSKCHSFMPNLFISIIFTLLTPVLSINNSIDKIRSLYWQDPMQALRLVDSLDAPEFQLYWLKGECYESLGLNKEAVKSYISAFETDSVQNNDQYYVNSILNISKAALDAGMYETAVKYSLLGSEKLEKYPESHNHSEIYSILSSVYLGSDDTRHALEYLDKAIAHCNSLSKKNARIYSNLCQYYISKSNIEKNINDLGEAIRSMLEADKAVNMMEEAGGAPPDYTTSMKTNISGDLTILYHLSGNMVQEKEWLDTFTHSSAYRGIFGIRKALSYYSLTENQDSLKTLSMAAVNYHKEKGDTVSNDYIVVLNHLQNYYTLQNNYRRAYKFLSESIRIKQLIEEQESKKNALSLAVLYDTMEKEKTINEQKLENYRLSRINTLLAIILLGALAILLIVIFILQTKRRNVLMTHQIISKNAVKAPMEADSLASKIVNAVEKDKLYLNPDFKRDDLAKILFTNKNQIITALQTSGMGNFTDYINSLRLKEAISLIENTEDTFESIAYQSGFGSLSTFFRVFKGKYGMTPKTFRYHSQHYHETVK